jgi:phenylpyruvate tautomerase PptA (4-oxalocrotonate tautomerase family)
MPVVFIEAPPGIRAEAKQKMVEKITLAIDEAYHIGDTLVFLREYPPENVAMDGRLQSKNPKILEALKKIGSEAIS